MLLNDGPTEEELDSGIGGGHGKGEDKEVVREWWYKIRKWWEGRGGKIRKGKGLIRSYRGDQSEERKIWGNKGKLEI